MSSDQDLARQAVGDFIVQLPRLLSKDSARRPARFVYQYTTIPALIAMFSPGRPYVETSEIALSRSLADIWATAAQYMNDAREFEHGREVFLAAINRARAVQGTEDRAGLLKLAEDVALECDGSSVFCACFSAADDHLGQWRGYGDNGRGCMIALDRDELDRNVNGLATWVAYNARVDRKHPSRRDPAADRVLEDLITGIAVLREMAASKVAFDISVRAQLLPLLPAVFLCFKDKAFKDEKEFRVIYSPSVAPRPLRADGVDVDCARELRWYRAVGSSIIPFVKLDFHDEARKPVSAPVKEVWLGPAAKSEINMAALKAMLKACGGADIRVRSSDIPYVAR